MTSATFYRRRAERFAQLLDEASGGRRRRSRSRADAELSHLVTLGNRTAALRPTVDTEIDPDFKTGLRAMLLATAEREGIGVTAVAAEPQAATRAASTGALARFGHKAGLRAVEGRLSRRGRRMRARGAVLAGVALGAIAVSSISTASEDAKPGDALYGVKRSAERAQLALASSDVNRGQLHLDFARTRLAEATAMNTAGTDLPTLLTDMDSDTRAGVKLLTTAAASRRDGRPLRAVEGFLTGQQAGVAALVGRLDGRDRQRAVESRALLAEVQGRVEALRRTIACGATPDASTDSLGPRPRTCGALPPDSAVRSDRRPGQPAAGRGERPGGAEKSPAAGMPSPGGSASPTARAAQSPTAPAGGPATPADDGLFGQLGRALRDLLGG